MVIKSSWDEYIFPVAGSGLLMALSYWIGSSGFSFLWILIFVTLHYLKTEMWQKRQRKILSLQMAARREKDSVLTELEKLQDLPTWVQFPDTERCEWINKLTLQLWPYVGEAAKRIIKEQIEPQVKANLPLPFKSFTFESMDMGDIPVRLGGIKVYTENVGRDKIVVDMDIAYAGDCNFVVSVGGFKAGLNNLQTFDFNLTGLGQMIELPGLFGAVKNVVSQQVALVCVIPHDIVIPIIPNVDQVKLRFPEPDGVVRIHLVQAQNLENKDFSFVTKGKSDPYVRVSVGAQMFKSKTIDNNLNPVWNEFFEAVVDQASGQLLIVECYDQDPGDRDEFLGRTTIDLALLREKGVIDGWYPLEGAKHGDIHIKVYWMDLSAKLTDLESAWQTPSDVAMYSALLLAYLDDVCNLPGPRIDLEPSPYVEMTVGNQTKKTLVKQKTSNPIYQQKFLFFVSKAEVQHMKLVAKQESSDRILGDLDFPISALLKEKNMELYQQSFHMSLGPHKSTVTMTLRLRLFVHDPKQSVAVKHNRDGEVTLVQKTIIDDLTTPASGPMDLVGELPGDNKLITNGQTAVLKLDKGIRRRFSNGRADSSIFSRLNATRMRSRGASEMVLGSLGQIHLTFRYNYTRNSLSLIVHKAERLLPLSDNSTPAQCYVKIRLLKAGKRVDKKRTISSANSVNPIWNETFEFPMSDKELAVYSLELLVIDESHYEFIRRHPVLGQITFHLNKFHPSKEIFEWFELGPNGYQSADVSGSATSRTPLIARSQQASVKSNSTPNTPDLQAN